ncbi:MAG: hypothetical protein IJU33_02480 [Bacteroidales bacterium]|nr:hypothetical protein [Bacteroidales bacterium]
MQNKLQELTDKLYQEGLSKGKQEGENLVAQAKAEAEKIIKDAQAEASRIVAEAQKEADDMKTKVTADIRMASAQSTTVTKQAIEQMIVAQAVSNNIDQALTAENFVKEMIKSVVSAFNPANAEPVDLDIILPESFKGKIESFVNNEISQIVKADVSVAFSKKIGGGFIVSPKNGGFAIRFTDEEFNQLITSYLRPATKKILFG